MFGERGFREAKEKNSLYNPISLISMQGRAKEASAHSEVTGELPEKR